MISFQPASLQQLASFISFCKYGMYLTVRKGKYIHRVVLFVILEGAVLDQSTHSHPCTSRTLNDSSFRDTGTINFFFKRKNSHRWAQKGISKGRNLSVGTRKYKIRPFNPFCDHIFLAVLLRFVV